MLFEHVELRPSFDRRWFSVKTFDLDTELLTLFHLFFIKLSRVYLSKLNSTF